MADTIRAIPANISASLGRLAVLFAYFGGIVVAVIGIMSSISIIGRSAFGRPITGDFELVEIGTAIAGSLFLPYCQTTYGHIAVDFFTLKASYRTRMWLDRFGCLLMAVMFFAAGSRAIIGSIDIYRSGETSMLLGVPVWIGYAGMLPGVFVAAICALAQACGLTLAERVDHE